MYRIWIFGLVNMLMLSVMGQNVPHKNVGSAEFKQLTEANQGTLMDVRTAAEFNNGHIKGASQLNYYEKTFGASLLLLPKNEPVYLYCTTGARSYRAAEFLASNGYAQVYNLSRGIMDWNLNNFPVVRGNSPSLTQENKMEMEDFSALVKGNSLVLVDFYAPWCGPCRKMMPMVDSLTTEYDGRIIISKVNVDASKNLVKELKLGTVPYFVLFKDGQAVFGKEGMIYRKELEDLFANYLNP